MGVSKKKVVKLEENNTSKYSKFEVAVAAYNDLDKISQIKASCAAPTGNKRRRNVAANILPTTRFANIWDGAVLPYNYGAPNTGLGGFPGANNISLRDAVMLCQYAYTFYGPLRTTIDILVEFSAGVINLVGGSAQSRKFFSMWFEKLNLWATQFSFYLDFYRASNVFAYKLQASLDDKTLGTLKEAFGAKFEKKKNIKLPIKYLFLNPADVTVLGTTTFLYPKYYKILNQYELATLFRNPSEESLKLIEQVPELKKIAKDYNGKNPATLDVVTLPLSPDHLVCAFYHKADYEGLGTPVFFTVMDAINRKIELTKIDLATNRQVLRATLLITMGSEEVGAPSEKQIAAMQRLFDSESITSVIVGDYTIKGQWLVPNMGELFDPKKYQEVDNEIQEGLGNILFSDGKYSSLEIKTKMFLARLEYGRRVFLEDFLKPEMEKIAKQMGFSKIPIPTYEKISLDDKSVLKRVYTQMAQFGFLTPSELFYAIETDTLPSEEESLVNQKKFAEWKKEGLYKPIVNSAVGSAGSGRPEGASAPQTTKTPGRVGVTNAKCSPENFRDTLLAATELEKLATDKVKELYKIKKLNDKQLELVDSLVEQIVVNEEKKLWKEKIDFYLDVKNTPKNTPIFDEIHQLAAQFGVDPYSGALFYHSLEPIKDKIN